MAPTYLRMKDMFLLKTMLCISFILTLTIQPKAQNNILPKVDRCYSDEAYEEMILEFPEYEANRAKIDAQVKAILSDPNREQDGEIITIPVVYHVIHNGDPIGSNENLSAAILQAQLDQLTDDFRRLNSDAGNTPADFLPVAADSEIEFCLAMNAPDGTATSGINRYNISQFSGVSESDCWNQSYINTNFKIPTIWDNKRYMNAWTVLKIQRTSDCADTVLGYANFPGGPDNTDGIVLRASTVGSIAMPNPGGGAFAIGRTGTHEVGHYLNLYHIWRSSGCSASDLVADTPTHDGPNYTGEPCTYPGPDSCDDGTGDLPDMFQNYMDYSDDACFNLFTTGQKNRMRAAIDASRPGLKTATCGPTEVNDLCINATEVSCGNVYAGSTVGGSSNGVGANCAGNGSSLESAGSWYKLSGDGGTYVASTCGDANFDTVIDIYSGTCTGLICEEGNDDATGCAGNTSEVSFATVSGMDYFIYVRSYFINSTGTFNLSIKSANIVSNSNDSGGGSLREVIACAEPGSTITFDPATDNNPIQLTSGQITINKDLTIIGNGMDITLIDGSLDDNSRIFQLSGGNDIRMESLTIQNGGSSTYAGTGAGIYISANLELYEVNFSGNSTTNLGSAILQLGGVLNIHNCIFDGNNSLSNDLNATTVWIQGSTSSASIFQSLFVNNNCTGGRVVFTSSNSNISNCTFESNITSSTRGNVEVNAAVTDFQFHNNINGDSGSTVLLFGSGLNATNNISIEPDSDLTTANNNIVGVPLFTDPTNGDYSLQNESPAIGAGNNDQIPVDILDIDGDGDTTEQIETDYAGNARIDGCSTNVDIGAFENGTAASMVVLNSNDDGYGSLRQAVECADPDATITFDPITNENPIQLTSGQIAITKDLSIIGNGPGLTILDGDLDDNSRIMSIDGKMVHLEGVSFINGGSNSYSSFGAGLFMFNDHDTSIENCHFEANETSGAGAALGTHTGSLSVYNSVFKENISTGVGAIAEVAFQPETATTLFNQCLFVNQVGSSQHITFTTDIEVIHSTFIQDGATCIGGGAESIVKNNIFKGTAPAVSTFGTGTTVSENNMAETLGVMPAADNIQDVAIFIDEGNEDYRLSACSSGIDEGVSLANSPAMDFEGDPRSIGTAIDMGYDEYAGADIIDIECGITYSGDTNNGANLIEVYNCTSDLESGPEIIYRITTTEFGDLIATLTNDDIDIDVAIFNECGNPNSCIDFGLTSATYSNAPIGTYYIVVDGYDGAAGVFDLTVTGSACVALPCTENLVEINAPDVPDGLYHAIETLQSDAIVTNTGVVYKAGNDIELNNNFEVQSDVEFDALIEDCIITTSMQNSTTQNMDEIHMEELEMKEREKRRAQNKK